MASPSSWLRVLALVLTTPLVACSGDDTSGGGGIADASQPAIPKIEAGAPCATNNDCLTGLSCLYPTTTCQAFRVCTTSPPSPCDHPLTMCSCLAEPIVTCDGFSTDPVDPTSTCDGGIVDAGQDSAPIGGNDSGADAGFDSGQLDASDASD